MGASESTAKTNNNATGDDQEKNRQSQQSSAGTSIGDVVALAATGVAAVGVVVWGISKALSEQNSADSHQNNNNNTSNNHGMESLLANNSRQIILEAGFDGKRSIWFPPPFGRLKMNTDGSCHPIPQNNPQGDRVKSRGPSGYGGILRDHRGNWVRGFRGFIDKETDCLTAEFYGIKKGLELLDKLGHKGAILESDCQGAVDWINKEWDDPNTSDSDIIRRCSDIIKGSRRLRRKNNTSVTHVIRQNANQCADKLANLAVKEEDEYVEIVKFSQLPYGVQRLIGEDKKGLLL